MMNRWVAQIVEPTAHPLAAITAMITHPCGGHVPQGSEAARLQLAEQSLGAMADAWSKPRKLVLRMHAIG